MNISVLLLRLRLIHIGWAQDQRELLEQGMRLQAACTWDDRLRGACTRFQLAHGRRGRRASGIPDEETWLLLWKP